MSPKFLVVDSESAFQFLGKRGELIRGIFRVRCAWEMSFDSNLGSLEGLDKHLPCGNDEMNLIGRGIICARAI